MVKAKEVKAEVAKPEQVAINVDKQEFIRTRDALITSWVHLEGALRDATHAYISHSNAVLGGEQSLDISKLDLTTFLGGQFVPSVDLKAEEDDTKAKAKRAPRKPKDPNAPKRPLTAYLAWLGDNREKIHGELGENQGRGGISAEGTKRWHALPDQAKQDYKNKYEKENERYKEDLKAYQARGGGPLETPAAEEEEVEITEPEAKAEAVSASSDSDSDSSDSDSESEDEVVPPKEPTPPPAKTPRSAAKGSKKKAAAAPVSSPPPAASSPVKADGGAFTAVNGTANNKRKKDAKAETAAEEPKTKRTRKVAAKEAAPAPVPTPVEPEATPKREKRDRKKARKSIGGDA